MFESSSKISDSATYDITAWSMPFVYGVKTYGLSAFVTAVTKTPPASSTTAITNSSSATAFVVAWNGLSSAKILATLLKKGVKVRYAEQSFISQGVNFEKGTLIITRTSNTSKSANLEQLVKEAAQEAGQPYYALQSGFVEKGFDFGSEKVRMIHAPKVTLLAGEGVSSLGMGEIYHFFDAAIKLPDKYRLGERSK